MKGICFKENLFLKTIRGKKTQTRRVMKPQPRGPLLLFNRPKPRYEIGETVYLKEPYVLYQETYQELKTNSSGLQYAYMYGNTLSIGEITGESKYKWGNKLFMPENAARYFIKITNLRAERLQDISETDCIKEGILSERDCLGYLHYHNSTCPENKKEAIDAHFGTMVNSYKSIGYKTPQAAYAALIDKINGKGTWKSNPFVWVYDYQLISNK